MLNAVVFNNDEIRKNINRDLGFSERDRVEQARRMGWLCDKVAHTGTFAIADFICPTQDTRRAFGDAFIVFVDVCRDSRYEDTKKMFQPPASWDYKITAPDFNPAVEAAKIREQLIDTRPASLFIGRFQPLHEGHKTLIQKALDEGKRVVVALRDRLGKDDPYTLEERRQMFKRMFKGQVDTVAIPDIEEVCYGRKVGYGIREIKLDEATEQISATAIREATSSADKTP